ncbi:AroM family protein [Variovorax sp. J22R133]|uniref:AroM family protein n=1 Tax=Variovorax brevis TaxID=3053503 RepID=UPI002577056A|nr:AroM family protein [Variovorax sp. J22R133]MDM0114276.1 AroM family protein [Variovorax sp. J22R133]
MSHPLLAFLTIGQSPRPDMTGAIVKALPAHVRTIECGVLDGLSPEAVTRDFAVREGAFPLISRLASGQSVALDEHAVERGLQRCIDQLEAQGANVVVVLCTGHFATLRTKGAWLIEPDRVVQATINNLAHGKRLGMIAPLPEQVRQIQDKWSAPGDELPCASASPYGPLDSLVDTARTLRDQGAQAIVLDCMGYTEQHKQAVVNAMPGLPVFVSASVLASTVGNLF